MVLIGLVSIVCGVALLVAEAHLPAGALGVAGAVALAVGAGLAIGGAGGGLALALAGVAAAGLVAAAWGGVIARTALVTRRRRVVSGREALSGRLGEVRAWNGDRRGQVLVDGALWQARASVLEAAPAEIHRGDLVVVERVSGLTLTVRRAEEWEEEP
ncbi:NfeD family protein [Conexibacter arvalis]|uniref:Membrane-bound serine protease (ClpP class) n=1 Tax=Conexibacter arvalis TaxID=912552 RepID=A0A840IC49_9ACTN|nr:membrane-bound serine protease (ClpP class) [Conexibacter arvalis]